MKTTNTIGVLLAALMAVFWIFATPASAWAADPSDGGVPPGVNLVPDVNECNAALAKMTSERDQAQASQANTKAELEALKKVCGATEVKPTGGKRTSVPITYTLICVGEGATKERDKNGFQYCDCHGRGVPAEIVDIESPAFKSNIVKGQCVVPYDEFDARMKAVEDALKNKADKGAQDDLADLKAWVKRLRTANIPLDSDTWINVNIRLTELEKRVQAILDAYCPATPDCADNDWACRCKIHEQTFCKEGDTRPECGGGSSRGIGSGVDLGVCGAFNLRPGTDSGALGFHAALNLWGNSQWGGYAELGCGGWSFNSDYPRYYAAGSLGAMLALTDDGSMVLTAGPAIVSEPVLDAGNGNDVLGFFGQLGFNAELTRYLVLKLQAGIGADTSSRYQFFPNGEVRTVRRGDWGVAGNGKLILAIRFGN